MLDLTLMQNALPQLFYGAWVSIKIASLASLFGFTLGTILGLLHAHAPQLLKWLINGYVTLIRGTPVLIQITFCYYVLPLIGLTFSSFWTAVLALSINSSAYISQIIRSGIIGVGNEQVEAAYVLGFTSTQTARYIIIPQALRIVLPALAGECITLVKESSLASTLGVMELYKEVRSIMNQTYDVLTVFFLAALFYLAMTSLVSFFFYLLSRKLNWHVNYS